jgi:hypothetical protein
MGSVRLQLRYVGRSPGQRWEDFVHTMDERVMVVEGAVEFEIAGVCHRPPPGETLLIPAGPCTRCATWAPVRPAGSPATGGGPGGVTRSLAGGLRAS